MEVVPVVAPSGVRAYIVPCPESDHAVLVGPLAELREPLEDALARGGWRPALELHCEPAPTVPLLARAVLVPTIVRERIVVRSPVGIVPLVLPDPERTLDPDDPLDSFICRVGSLEVRALACGRAPTELVWHLGSALFTNRVLYGPGVWPAAATPLPALQLRGDLAVYPRHATSGHPVSTVALERAWYHRWRQRGYDPDVPDPSATIPSAPARVNEG